MRKNITLICGTLFILMAIACSGESGEWEDSTTDKKSMILQIGDTKLAATLADNSSAEALAEALAKAPITIDMRDYGNMEKVGSLGRDFPTNNESITTEPGDIILYQGSALVIYYAPNTWNFTRLGKIDDISKEELMQVLGEGDITITLSLPEE
ncbi:cyclophilin-like fold protein [uncultured Draconibacterium sp.]|uniref:cyclophilin-like fold protein n=1 Tax=uncultured Draconibacterium sp. TaxID=1573823 RepID=UPI002AA6F0CF|nr:cyclophilin-like fold protein [uncultured Draconibacterium sp.]